MLALDEEIAELDALIEAWFHEHRHATVIRSLPGMGTLLGAEFIAAAGGDLEAFGTADRLASFAGLSPVPRDSGCVSGNMRRPRRYHRGLLRAFYLSAMASLRTCSPSQAYYGCKRNEGQTGPAGFGPPTGQRLVGHDPRRSVLPSTTNRHVTTAA
ncbi:MULTISPECIES: transposase [unclassified Streptomyces]|uniref:transposase n=1 Tax=unclassified Streptomyces TaxID=2593676 RepID=UPI002B1DBEC7|nr:MULTISPECIES: transposase [unclassified Streptomyces]